MTDHALTLWVIGTGYLANAGALLHLSSTVRQLVQQISLSECEREARRGPIDEALRGGLSELAWRADSGKDSRPST